MDRERHCRGNGHAVDLRGRESQLAHRLCRGRPEAFSRIAHDVHLGDAPVPVDQQPQHDVAFVLRRQLHEAVVHTVDAEQVAGAFVPCRR